MAHAGSRHQSIAKAGDTVTEKRIMARFTPQAWIRDYATDIDGAYDFDVTAQVVAMPKAEALALTDNSDAADNLWLSHQVSGERPHNGPFRVEVQDEIASYFEVTA